MTGLTLLGMVMLVVMIFAIFIGFPISFTLLFLALTFGYFGLGRTVFDLAYFQTIGMMKEELLAAVPLFIFMGFITEQAGLMERLFSAFRMLLAPVRGALFLVVIVTSAVFAMATGIVGAAVTVLGIMASPIMIKTGYDAKLSAGAITRKCAPSETASSAPLMSSQCAPTRNSPLWSTCSCWPCQCSTAPSQPAHHIEDGVGADECHDQGAEDVGIRETNQAKEPAPEDRAEDADQQSFQHVDTMAALAAVEGDSEYARD